MCNPLCRLLSETFEAELLTVDSIFSGSNTVVEVTVCFLPRMVSRLTP